MLADIIDMKQIQSRNKDKAGESVRVKSQENSFLL